VTSFSETARLFLVGDVHDRLGRRDLGIVATLGLRPSGGLPELLG